MVCVAIVAGEDPSCDPQILACHQEHGQQSINYQWQAQAYYDCIDATYCQMADAEGNRQVVLRELRDLKDSFQAWPSTESSGAWHVPALHLMTVTVALSLLTMGWRC